MYKDVIPYSRNALVSGETSLCPELCHEIWMAVPDCASPDAPVVPGSSPSPPSPNSARSIELIKAGLNTCQDQSVEILVPQRLEVRIEEFILCASENLFEPQNARFIRMMQP